MSDEIVNKIVDEVMIIERLYAFEKRNVTSQRRSEIISRVEKILEEDESKKAE